MQMRVNPDSLHTTHPLIIFARQKIKCMLHAKTPPLPPLSSFAPNRSGFAHPIGAPSQALNGRRRSRKVWWWVREGVFLIREYPPAGRRGGKKTTTRRSQQLRPDKRNTTTTTAHKQAKATNRGVHCSVRKRGSVIPIRMAHRGMLGWVGVVGKATPGPGAEGWPPASLCRIGEPSRGVGYAGILALFRESAREKFRPLGGRGRARGRTQERKHVLLGGCAFTGRSRCRCWAD